MPYEGQEEIVLIPRRDLQIWGKGKLMCEGLIITLIALLFYLFFIDPIITNPSLIAKFVAFNLFVTSFPLLVAVIILLSTYPPTVVMNGSGIYFHQKFGRSRINDYIPADVISSVEYGRAENWRLVHQGERKEPKFQQISSGLGLVIHLQDKSRHIICLSWYEDDINKQKESIGIIIRFCQEVYNRTIERTTEEWVFVIVKGEQVIVKPPPELYLV